MNPDNRAIIVATSGELYSLVKGAVQEALAVVERRSHKEEETFNEKEAAKYLRKKPGTLRQWRSESKGPAYHKKGRRILYKKADLDKWLSTGRVLTGESESPEFGR